MEYKFGELGSAEEINELAKNLLNEGDYESIYILAKENGIPREYAEYFIAWMIEELCDPQTAAIGKLDLEAQELKAEGIMVDWVEYIKTQCMDSEEIARAVKGKGKSLKGCIGKLLQWGVKHQTNVDKEILRTAEVKASRVTFGMPGMAEAKKIIRSYYLDKTKDKVQEAPAEKPKKSRK